MKIFRNFLDEATLSLVLEEFNFKKNKAAWTASSQLWPEHLTKNTFSDCMVSPLIPTIASRIEKKVNESIDILYSSLAVSMHIWRPGSSINLHDDGVYTFGATLYLNKEWNIHDGGILMWKSKSDEDDISWNAIIPSFNTLVVNDETDLHFTTPVSFAAKENKVSLQIFGLPSWQFK